MSDPFVLSANYSINKKTYHTDRVLASHLLRLQAEGCCEVALNGAKHTLKPGDLLICQPGDSYVLTIGAGLPGGPVRSSDYYLFSSSPWIADWRGDGLPAYVHIGLDEQVLLLWKSLIHEKRKTADADPDILEALLRLLYMAVKRLIAKRGAGSGNRYIPYKMKTYIEQNAARKFTLQEVAESVSLGISRSSQLFKETFNQSVMEYAMEVRLAMAKDRIAYDNTTLEEISHSCGFPTYSYFSRAFHARFGLSPSEFKRNNRTPPQ